ncbi:MAG TPA: hypothetical protein VH599_21170 [Ktedonobacterales bacterium]|jgi:hypothetical protein
MKFRDSWRPLSVMLLIGLAAGIANVLLFIFVMNPLTEGGKEDEVAVSTYVLNLFVGWVFFSAWFLARADDELKKVEEAVHKGDKETFLVEAPKQIALSIRILYFAISALVLLSFHLFHMGNSLVTIETQFGMGFLVITTALFLWDLDEPIGGAVGVTDAPEEWLQELRERKALMRGAPASQKTAESVEAKRHG